MGSIIITYSGEHPEMLAAVSDFTSRQLQQAHAGSITNVLPDMDVQVFFEEIGAMANEGMGIIQNIRAMNERFNALGGDTTALDNYINTLGRLFNEIDSRASIMEMEDNS